MFCTGYSTNTPLVLLFFFSNEVIGHTCFIDGFNLISTDSRCQRKHMAMGLLCIDGDFGCIFRDEFDSWCAERVNPYSDF